MAKNTTQTLSFAQKAHYAVDINKLISQALIISYPKNKETIYNEIPRISYDKNEGFFLEISVRKIYSEATRAGGLGKEASSKLLDGFYDKLKPYIKALEKSGLSLQEVIVDQNKVKPTTYSELKDLYYLPTVKINIEPNLETIEKFALANRTLAVVHAKSIFDNSEEKQLKGLKETFSKWLNENNFKGEQSKKLLDLATNYWSKKLGINEKSPS